MDACIKGIEQTGQVFSDFSGKTLTPSSPFSGKYMFLQ
jgi:hypothetical protein